MVKRKIMVGDETYEVTEFKFNAPRELALRAMGEIREQLKLQFEIFKTLCDPEAFAEFKKAFLKAIEGVSE